MKTAKTAFLILMVLSVFSLLATTAMAGEKEDILGRMKGRLANLTAVKNAGKIGEVYTGYVEAVKPEHAADATVAGLISAENADRARLYALDAASTGGSQAAVGETYAKGFFDRAAKGHWLKYKDGWKQK